MVINRNIRTRDAILYTASKSQFEYDDVNLCGSRNYLLRSEAFNRINKCNINNSLV